MTDIFLPGLGPAFTDWAHCVGLLEGLGLSHNDSVVLAAIGGPESGYDYHVINDTPATGDYSVGIWQVNYYGPLYPGRTAEFGTPRQLAAGGPPAQARAAALIFRQQGFMAWATTYTSGDWRQYVGSGPVPPIEPGPGGPPGVINLPQPDLALVRRATRDVAKAVRVMADQAQAVNRKGVPGWRPGVR